MAIILLLLVLGLGAAALLGRTPDSRDSEYDLGRLMGRPTTTPESPDEVEAAQSTPLTVPAAWLTRSQVVAR